MTKKIFLSILFCIFISACVGEGNQAPKIRIVDANGVYRPINTYVPILNSQLQQQKQNQLAGISSPTTQDPDFNIQPHPVMDGMMQQQIDQQIDQNIEQPIDQIMEKPIEEVQLNKNQAQGSYDLGMVPDKFGESNYSNPSKTPTLARRKAKYNFGNSNKEVATNNVASPISNGDVKKLGTIKRSKKSGILEEQSVPKSESKKSGILEEQSVPKSAKSGKSYKISQGAMPKTTNLSVNQNINSADIRVGSPLVQLGIYASQNNANAVLSKSQNIAPGFIKEVKSGQSNLYKVFLGPLADENEAEILLKKVNDEGFKGSFITKAK